MKSRIKVWALTPDDSILNRAAINNITKRRKSLSPKDSRSWVQRCCGGAATQYDYMASDGTIITIPVLLSTSASITTLDKDQLRLKTRGTLASPKFLIKANTNSPHTLMIKIINNQIIAETFTSTHQLVRISKQELLSYPDVISSPGTPSPISESTALEEKGTESIGSVMPITSDADNPLLTAFSKEQTLSLLENNRVDGIAKPCHQLQTNIWLRNKIEDKTAYDTAFKSFREALNLTIDNKNSDKKYNITILQNLFEQKFLKGRCKDPEQFLDDLCELLEEKNSNLNNSISNDIDLFGDIANSTEYLSIPIGTVKSDGSLTEQDYSVQYQKTLFSGDKSGIAEIAIANQILAQAGFDETAYYQNLADNVAPCVPGETSSSPLSWTGRQSMRNLGTDIGVGAIVPGQITM